MAEIVRGFRESIPNVRFIGKKYEGFGHWGEWWQNGWFDVVEKAMGGVEKLQTQWENAGGYIGVEERGPGGEFHYYIGMLTPEGTEIPEGFIGIDFHRLDLGTCWIYGKEKEVHQTKSCRAYLEERGMIPWVDAKGAVWSFENCLCPRYTTPDEKGNVILDYCYFIQRNKETAIIKHY